MKVALQSTPATSGRRGTGRWFDRRAALSSAAMQTVTTELIARLIEVSDRRLRHARPLFAAAGVRPPTPIYRFDLTGRAAGQVIWPEQGPPQVRYNLGIAVLQPEAFVAETVPHEIAHLVTGACHRKARPHGPEWRRVMAFFGIEQANRCHAFEIDQTGDRSQRRWPYRCACDTHQLSTTRHNRVRNGRQTYLCRRCGNPLQPIGHD
jgi:SprT protein